MNPMTLPMIIPIKLVLGNWGSDLAVLVMEVVASPDGDAAPDDVVVLYGVAVSVGIAVPNGLVVNGGFEEEVVVVTEAVTTAIFRPETAKALTYVDAVIIKFGNAAGSNTSVTEAGMSLY